MKLNSHIALAFLLIALLSLVPASAYASARSGGGRHHSQSYRDRTPRVHSHGSHRRHG